jgi:hypothetical protein
MISISNTYILLCRPLLGTIFLSGRIRKRPEKSKKSKVFHGFGVHRHSAEIVAIDGIRRYF